MKSQYGISDAEMEKILDQYVLNQGGRLDVNRLREGLGELIRKNNEALLKDLKSSEKTSGND